jgi:glycosyltransferase involved in cell wall biosynthesis
MIDAQLKVLLVGPYPPPHGGISIHVWNARAILRGQGVPCEVLNVEPRAPESDEYIKISGSAGLALQLARYCANGWTVHTHINGHTPKSWLIALASGMAAQMGAGGVLTIHSGLSPEYLRNASSHRRRLTLLAALQFNRIVCVNDEIAGTMIGLGVESRKLEILPAFLPQRSGVPAGIPKDTEAWMRAHRPVLSTALTFRPEYGFDVLVRALKQLKARYPGVGCVVMGNGEDRAAVEKTVKDDGLSAVVRLLGDVDHDLCLTLMSRSDVFVRPTFRDGDSISVREAVALGVPVVASNVGTRPGEVRLFEAGDAAGLCQQVESALKSEKRRAAASSGGNAIGRFRNLYSF